MADNVDVDLYPEIGSKYYTVPEFEDQCLNNNLTIFHQNIRSFNRNYDYLSVFLGKFNKSIDIIALSETWFSDNFTHDIEGYKSFHSYRKDRNGGGISIYVKKEIGVRCVSNKCVVTNDLESCVVELHCGNGEGMSGKLIIYGIYRPPSASLVNFTETLNLSCLELNNNRIIFVGDFNIDLMDDESSTDFSNMMYSNSMYPLINVPTRVTDSSATCIDHIWYNEYNVSHSGCFVSDISDHYLVFCVLNITSNKTPIRKTIRDRSENCLQLFETSLSLLPEQYFIDNANNSVDDKTEYFLDRINSSFNEFCPIKIKTVSYKKYTKPWITSDLISLINYKHILFKRYKQLNVPFSTYNDYKNNLCKVLKRRKIEFYNNRFNRIKNDTRENWRTINDLMGMKRYDKYPDVIKNADGEELRDPLMISNLFSDYFSSIAHNLSDSIPVSNSDPLSYLSGTRSNSFFAVPATIDEVIRTIMSLPNRGGNIGSIPVSVYKRVSNIIAPIIVDIFNSSINEGIFPSVLKMARIVPICKSKSSMSVNGYRPISILHTLSKIIEKLMKSRVTSYLDRENILCNEQYGFRSGLSTSDAVLEFTSRCTKNLDNRLFTIAVCLDLSKAFDTIDKSIIINKLEKLGFRGNIRNWFESYLTDRGMFVDVCGVNSRTTFSNIGLPQGSVSSPYLFSLYVNDMCKSSNKLEFIHYADDTTVLMSGSDLQSLCRDVSIELNRVSDWLRCNRLLLNIEKTSFMLFTHSNIVDVPLSVSIGDNLIERSRCVKFLGILIDDRLNYNTHVLQLSKKLSRTAGIMRKVANYMPHVILRQVYFSLFQSVLDYGVVVWGGCGITNRNKIIRAQNKAVSLLSELPLDVPQPLSFEKQYIFKVLCQFHKYIGGTIRSDHFTANINQLIPVHEHRTRFHVEENVNVPHTNKTITQKQFFYNAVMNWNKLPLQLRRLNEGKFRHEIKKWLVSN